MPKDIRSFFKPLTKTKTQEKVDTKDSEQTLKHKVKSSGKESSKESIIEKKTNKSSRSSDSKNGNKYETKNKIQTKKIEVISSDSDSDIASVKNFQREEKKQLEKNKTTILSSDSDPDIASKKEVKKSSTTKDTKKTSEKIKRKVGDLDKKTSITESSKSVNLKKLSNVSKKGNSDSDDDTDFINPTPDKANNKKRKLQISSDSEDDSKTKCVGKLTKPQNKEELKPVSISDIFSRKVNQSNIKTAVKPPEPAVKKSKKVKTELGVHEDKDFEKTLIDLDDDIFLQNEDILDKTIEGAMHESPKEKKVEKTKSNSDDYKSASSIDISYQEISSTHTEKLSKKRPIKHDEDDTPSKSKKIKLGHTDSGFDDQDRYEKKKYCAMQYQQYLNRGGPKNHGCKELPKGKPDCLSNLVFLRTGVLDSLEAEEFENLVKEHGGKVVHSVTKKVNYVVVGEEPGPTKLQKAENYKIPTISEDELLDMILQKSGMPKKYTVTCKLSSFEDAGINDSFVSNESEETVQPKEVNIKKYSDLESTDKKKNNTNEINLKVQEKKEGNIDSRKTENKEEAKITKKLPDNNENQETDNNTVSLSEKYKPKDLKQIVGQQTSNSNMNRLKKWLECWHMNERLRKQKKIVQPKPWDKTNDGGYFKCALLSGPPGVGKTTTATLVAESLGYDIVEFNASDTRSKKLLQNEVATALNSQNIASFNIHSAGLDHKRVILMDEVDGMAGNEDRGGMQELISLIKTSKIPIICMCNDRNHQKMKTLANYCFDLRFEKPKPQQILGFVMSICCKEGIKVNPQIATEIINGTTCDIRQTLNQLSMLSNLDEAISLEQAKKDSANAKKDTILGPWQVCKMVFNAADQKDMSLIDKSRLFFYDYSMGPLFVQENYLKVQPNVDKNLTMRQVAAAAEAISVGASIDKKIRESNNWSLLDLQAIYSSVLPGHYMSGQVTGAIDFPSWLGKNSKRNKIKRMTNELSSHTRIQTSGGLLAMNLDYSKALLTSIVTPLKRRGLEGVSDAVEVMKTYQLLREDLDNLVEVCSGPKQKNLMDGVESKVKAAFTRLYNKEVPIFSYSANTGVSKKKASALYEDNELNDDEVDETSETEDTIENDNLIKAKSKSKSQNKKEPAKASTSKQNPKAKGRGKK